MNKRDFERFYQENMERIYRYVFFRVGRNVDVAEDLVSEIFMKALKNFEKYDPKISKSAWIYRIAHNHLANYFRDKKQAVDIDDVSFMLIGEDGNRTMEQIEAQKQLGEMLGILGKDDKRLVTMKYIEGYSYREIGEIVDKTEDAVKVATYRAMKKLKKRQESGKRRT
jgi:RNA polymerase sigma-70 factor, ECF subfamily